MDLTTTTTTTTTPTKSSDIENDTPPQTQPIKPLSFTNGALKKHHPRRQQHHHHNPPAVVVVVAYKECLKNHAASLGGHALDGCGEFMPSPTATPSDPTSLKCAACGCHRNFHRREPDDSTTHYLDFHRHPPTHSRNSPSPSPPPRPPSYYPSAPHMLLVLSTAVPDDQPRMKHQPVATPPTPTTVKAENTSGRKRFRTKFSKDQKEKMFSFSESWVGRCRSVMKEWWKSCAMRLGLVKVSSRFGCTSTRTF